MTKIGAFEAKTHLSELLNKVEHGTRFQILRRGKPVAQLTGIHCTENPERTEEALVFFRALRRKAGVPPREVRNWIKLGRR